MLWFLTVVIFLLRSRKWKSVNSDGGTKYNIYIISAFHLKVHQLTKHFTRIYQERYLKMSGDTMWCVAKSLRMWASIDNMIIYFSSGSNLDCRTDWVYMFLCCFSQRWFQHAIQKDPPHIEFIWHGRLWVSICKKEGDNMNKIQVVNNEWHTI